MKWHWYLFSLIVLLLLAGCGRAEDPDSLIAGGTFAPQYTQVQVVTLEQLAANPTAYQDQLIQISGQYQRLPRLACVDATPRKGPATWALSNGELLAQAGGFDMQVNSLLPAGLDMTVEGTWRYWEGLVGCGKLSDETKLWYLDVSNIVSPRPLVQVTLTPAGVAAITGDEVTLTPTTTATPTPGAAATEIGSSPPGPIGPPAVATDQPPTPEGTATPAGYPAPGDITATPTVTVTASGLPLTGTLPAGTPSNEATPTVTNTPPPGASLTPTPSSTPAGEPTIAEQGDAEVQSLIVETMNANESHSYTLAIAASTSLTISLVMPPEFDPKLKLLNPAGGVVLDQNNSPAGEVERVNGVLLESGTYELIISEAANRETPYALTLQDDESFNLHFQNPLTYGDVDNTVMRPNSIDYWHFYGRAGDSVTISTVPNDQSDLLFLVMDPQLEDVTDDYVDERGQGQPEQITLTLPVDGLYTIQVEEYAYGEADYLIRLTTGTAAVPLQNGRVVVMAPAGVSPAPYHPPKPPSKTSL